MLESNTACLKEKKKKLNDDLEQLFRIIIFSTALPIRPEKEFGSEIFDGTDHLVRSIQIEPSFGMTAARISQINDLIDHAGHNIWA